jgi:hypothetical protein
LSGREAIVIKSHPNIYLQRRYYLIDNPRK